MAQMVERVLLSAGFGVVGLTPWHSSSADASYTIPELTVSTIIRPWLLVRLIWQVAVASLLDTDIVLVHGARILPLLYFLGVRSDQMIVWLHIVPRWWQGLAYQVFFPRAQFVAISRYVQDSAARVGVHSALIENGARVPQAIDAARGNPDVLGYIGRLSPEKGIHTLLRVAESFPSLRLVIVGSGPLEPELLQYAKKNPGRLICLGWQLEPWRQLGEHECGIVLVPSVWPEPFGLVAVEACMHRILPLCRRVGGLADIVEAIGIPSYSSDQELISLLGKRIEILATPIDLRTKALALYSEESYRARLLPVLSNMIDKCTALPVTL